MRDGVNWDAPGRVHMLGVCGVGMAGVAYLLASRGWRVSGCDAQLGPLAGWLRAAGVPVAEGHDPAHLEGAGRVVVTPAVGESEAELAAARARGLAVFRRGEVLAALMSGGRGVAVCGAHGKTTTACFATRLLQELGAAPGWCVGGMTRRMGGVAGGAGGKLLVAEADESDGTLALYHPAVTVVTNIDLDHLEHFDGEAALEACFRQAVAQTREGVAACRDDARAWRAAGAAGVRVLGYGFSEEAELRAADVRVSAAAVSFDVWYGGRARGRVTLGVSGRHNVLNALGAAAGALLLGHGIQEVLDALPAACGELPERRFDEVAAAGGVRFVADYAHHPAELAAAVEMARVQGAARLVAVFQPHRYTRTLALGAAFPAAFAGADEVILLPVYAASEAPLEGGDICDLYDWFRRSEIGARVKLGRSLEEVWGYLRQTLRAGDLVLIAGAGDVIGLAGLVRADVAAGWPARRGQEAFGAALRQVAGAAVEEEGRLDGWSFFGVGGRARWRVEVSGEEALAAVARLCGAHGVAWRMAGAGANAWFSDLGEPGCVVRFAEGACAGFEETGAGEVAAGCGWRGRALLDRLEREGFAGLEFLDSVPGSLGGWLAMNAGAHGGEIGARVRWIRCLNREGEISILGPVECGFAYRACRGLEGRVALACGLALERAAPEQVRARRQEARGRRIPLAGLRTEGSVFRNPEGGAAGRLLEAAGCKGMRIGGAWVTDVHANVVAVDGSATASDVLALVMRMRNRVAARSGVVLRTEIRGLGE